ncbi:MAG: lysophospholipid acyltransferase family protein [Alphaproteobacteria bacterium]|nr:lysophospholipid acyltransferase family protein [Alphaproteobacteria bacterium]
MCLFKKISKSPYAIRIASFFCYWYVRFVALTTRWEKRDIDVFYKNLKEHNAVIFIAWHGRIALAPYFWNQCSKLSALVSPHRDGQLIAGLLKRFGIENISGSTNENPRASAVRLLRELKNNASIAIIPDGPRGPSMTMSMSPIYYAKTTGKPIIGMTYSIARSKILGKSWDRMLLPLPFQKGIVAVTKPFFIEKNTPKEKLEEYRLQIEKELNELTWQLDNELNLPKIEQGTLSAKLMKQQRKD